METMVVGIKTRFRPHLQENGDGWRTVTLQVTEGDFEGSLAVSMEFLHVYSLFTGKNQMGNMENGRGQRSMKLKKSKRKLKTNKLCDIGNFFPIYIGIIPFNGIRWFFVQTRGKIRRFPRYNLAFLDIYKGKGFVTMAIYEVIMVKTGVSTMETQPYYGVYPVIMTHGPFL